MKTVKLLLVFLISATLLTSCVVDEVIITDNRVVKCRKIFIYWDNAQADCLMGTSQIWYEFID